MQEIVDIIISNGFAAAMLAFFMVKDMTLNNKILNVLTELRTIIKTLSNIHTKGDSE
jgi:hypothetical protein